jgi:hypothetical protein
MSSSLLRFRGMISSGRGNSGTAPLFRSGKGDSPQFPLSFQSVLVDGFASSPALAFLASWRFNLGNQESGG